ncbi:PilW family protein [Sedimenticola sp.]|uniref:PilW family protein n=1 Tax=Sedimenticola sp. TaxID=1940285 RepID=UPI003D0BCB48
MDHKRSTRFRQPRPYSGQCGMSLIEIMIAITISLILLAGVVQIFVSNKQSFRVQSSMTVLQENARFAIDNIRYALRMAGQFGGSTISQLQSSFATTAISVTGDCATDWALEGAANQGYAIWRTSSTTGSPLSGCIPDSDYVLGTDIVVIRFGDGVPVADAAVTATSVYARAETGNRTVLSLGSNITSVIPSDTNVLNFPMRVEVYYVRPCSVIGGGSNATQCDSTDDDGNPIRTLARLTLSGTTLQNQALVEGVEDMRILFGVDNNNADGVDLADAYTNTPTWGSATQKIVSARLGILVRSTTLDLTVNDTATYNLAGFSVGVPAGAANYLRKAFNQTVELRNLTRGI